MNRAAILFLAALTLAGGVHAAVQPRIQSPTPDQAVFGEVDVSVLMSADEPVTRVEIFVNGVRRAVLTQPPFRTRIDVGEDNNSREFKVVAYGASGSTGTHSVATDAIRIDDEIEVRLQQLFVTVTRSGAADARRILDLEQEDFRILDNGKAQEIVTFGKGEVPITAVLLLDTS